MSQFISRRSNSFHIHAPTEPSVGWAGDFLLVLPRAIQRAWRTHADQMHLEQLSDHQLRDIGIQREHIPHIVRNGWDI